MDIGASFVLHPRWSNGSEEWRHVPEAFRCELRLPPEEPEQYVAIAFQICGFLRERRIGTGNKSVNDKYFGSHELHGREQVVQASSDRGFGYVFRSEERRVGNE